MTELSFIHRFEPGAASGSRPLLILHGTGGDENDLVPLGKMVAPGAPLLSPRGKVLEHGMPRFFRRLAEGVFDEQDVRARAHELADFVDAARKEYILAACIRALSRHALQEWPETRSAAPLRRKSRGRRLSASKRQKSKREKSMGQDRQLRGRREILGWAGRVCIGSVIGPAVASAAPGSSPETAAAGAGSVPLCTSASSMAEPTFYSEMAESGRRMHHAMEITASGDIDRDFMRMMIPHHQGAIDMALLQLKYGRDEKLKRLAQSIIVEQGQEIAYMRTLLARPAAATSSTPASDR
jgi:hypothetical protein